MEANKTEEKIFSILVEQGEIHTKKVAELAKITPSVASKYLGFLEKEGKIILREQKPFKFWRVKEKS
ncbi:MAG: winged helix-turn-helix domain-containing protein [Candidatus Bathyarchaeota archaeon]|uniref:winged helix-turn-helix domain-containing protein n=1 Tax=Candidatus Bathycorpusculum sp. TaxID=2994959 RepID=UPI00282435B8|nr:winged helix-turn-helix domain-containing protein [Candidatus Termiticorpusculum sp.]MCL2258144.1 winged helix-turn-helix domain-containing protein [Candidatus Termiticorpusculum sp.]MCL2291572.1 winged helix-turn-helix domain-containing protein [Candidatus Termiticorpusculum sp.]